MKLHETIELNGKEYTVELNRESIIRIEQFTNSQKSMEIMNKTLFNDKSEEKIIDGANPFEEIINDDDFEKLAKEKEETLKKVFNRAFWIWLYPIHRLNYSEVEEILAPYYIDDDKAEFIAERYTYYTEQSVKVREEYINEQKNLKALTN